MLVLGARHRRAESVAERSPSCRPRGPRARARAPRRRRPREGDAAAEQHAARERPLGEHEGRPRARHPRRRLVPRHAAGAAPGPARSRRVARLPRAAAPRAGVARVELALRFQLRRAGWVAAITANDGAHFEAVRLSRDPARSVRVPRGHRAGRVRRGTSRSRCRSLGEGWHALALKREGDALAVSLDGAPDRALRGARSRSRRASACAARPPTTSRSTTSRSCRARRRSASTRTSRTIAARRSLFGGALALLLALDVAVARAARQARAADPRPRSRSRTASCWSARRSRSSPTRVWFGRIYPERRRLRGLPEQDRVRGPDRTEARGALPARPAAARRAPHRRARQLADVGLGRGASRRRVGAAAREAPERRGRAGRALRADRRGPSRRDLEPACAATGRSAGSRGSPSSCS